jgi:Flp pilus assembly protein TadD
MVKRRLPGSLAISLMMLCWVSASMAQAGLRPGATDTGLGGGNAIAGTILLPTGQRPGRPLSVRLQTMTKGDRLTATDENGNFAFSGLPNGSYTIVIDKQTDYEVYRGSVDIRQFGGSPPQVYQMNIRLQFKPGVEVKPGVVNAEFANVPAHAVELYQSAIELAKNGKTKEAIDSLKKAITEYSNFMLAFNELGVQYTRRGELDKANEALVAALKISPDAPMPLLNHGIVLAMAGKFDLAIVDLERALKQKEQLANGHLYLGQVLANVGRLDESEKHLNRAIELAGDEMKDAHKFLGGIYLARGDRARGVAELEKYLKLSPNAKDADQIRQVIRQNQKP